MTKKLEREMRAKAAHYRDLAAKIEEVADLMMREESFNDPPVRSAKIEEIKEYVKDQGTVTRKQLHEAGYPVGTVNSVLKEENGFHKTGHGQWSIEDEENEETEEINLQSPAS